MQKVQNIFAVTVPGRLQSASQSPLYQRSAGAMLVWQQWRIDGTSRPKFSGTSIEFRNEGPTDKPAIWRP